jgi:hypothetical protein
LLEAAQAVIYIARTFSGVLIWITTGFWGIICSTTEVCRTVKEEEKKVGTIK